MEDYDNAGFNNEIDSSLLLQPIPLVLLPYYLDSAASD